MTVGARQSLSSRLKVGGDYTIQRANTGQPPVVGGGEPLQIASFTIQNAVGSVAYEITPTIVVDGGAGVSYLSLPGEIARTGPAGHVSLSKRTEHAFLTLSAKRSFVPAFGFGGSVSNQEVRATVRVPFARKRAYVDGGISWRDSEPVRVKGTPATSTMSVVGDTVTLSRTESVNRREGWWRNSMYPPWA